MGIDRIQLAAPQASESPLLDAFVIAASHDHRAQARKLTAQLRRAGVRVDMTDRDRSMKVQFKEADRSRASVAVIVGSEWDRGEVTVKRLDTGDQDVIAVKEIESWLRG